MKNMGWLHLCSTLLDFRAKVDCSSSLLVIMKQMSLLIYDACFFFLIIIHDDILNNAFLSLFLEVSDSSVQLNAG
jgi:hypothetical protein